VAKVIGNFTLRAVRAIVQTPLVIMNAASTALSHTDIPDHTEENFDDNGLFDAY
jgi:hypothetical protein